MQAPKDLVGKTDSNSAGDATTTMFFALFARTISIATGKDLCRGRRTRNQMFLSKRAKAITGFSDDSYLGFKDANPNIAASLLGLRHRCDERSCRRDVDYLTSSPDMVRGFITATVRAYKYALAHPDGLSMPF